MSILQQRIQKTVAILAKESINFVHSFSKQAVCLTENWQNWNPLNLKLVQILAISFAVYFGYWILTALKHVTKILLWILYYVFVILQWIARILFWVLSICIGLRIILDLFGNKSVSSSALNDFWSNLARVKNNILKIWWE